MPSTTKMAKACPQCYIGIDMSSNCPKCGSEGQVFSFYKLTVPKRNNRRAWKRMFNGERFWDRRKVKRKSTHKYHLRERERPDYNMVPHEVDFGG